MRDAFFEVCTKSLESARAAEAGGANRIELCTKLSIGGVTPGLRLIATTIKAISIPVHVLIRPRGGDFVYSIDEFDHMRRQIAGVKQAGAAGVVLGVLHPDGRVDAERTRVLVERALPMTVTFHRAFDAVPNQSEALETVIEMGVDCLLTSGGEPDALAGVAEIALLRKQAFGRLKVMAGGGLTLTNLVEVVRRTGVNYLHASLTGRRDTGEGDPQNSVYGLPVQEADVREAIRLFRAELAARENGAKILG